MRFQKFCIKIFDKISCRNLSKLFWSGTIPKGLDKTARVSPGKIWRELSPKNNSINIKVMKRLK
ncbi:MAG: hypothetical protein B6245_08980 [Desulfobacteraceae bacterium 4572_88]|nr:MAG: hypothetical protein B6245_08980 [Desulfobacteraceae bacterium 4572_88]